MNLPGNLSSSTPVLCIDTCSVLDIMRDPVRESSRAHDRQAALEIVNAVTAGNVVCLIAEQVSLEFLANHQDVQEETDRSVKKLQEQVERVQKIASVYGAAVSADLSNLNDHATRARQVIDRLLSHAHPLVPAPLTHSRAYARVNANIAPARKGKESSKDCLVFETYLEAMQLVRQTGHAAPLVFLSSNKNDYRTDGGRLKPDIMAVLDPLNAIYVENTSMAKRALQI